MEHSKLGQLLKSNDSGLPEAAYHFNIPSGVLFPSEIIFYSGVLPQWISYIKDCKDHFLYLHLPQWSFNKTGNFTRIADLSNIPDETVLLRIHVIKEIFKDKSTKKSSLVLQNHKANILSQ